MTNQDHLRGVVCPMVTPFDSQGRVDFTAAGSLTDFLIERGINCLFVGGSTGEVIFLSAEERKKLSEFVIRHTAGRIPVIVQTGAETTQITVELTLHAKRSGATAASILVPYYFRYENEALLAYFETIAETVPDFPILLYIFPAFTGNDVSPALLKWLGDNVPNLVGMKVSNPDLIRFQDYLSVVDERFVSLFGVDGLMLPALSIGAWGQVSGTANAFPEPFLDLYKAFEGGELQKANEAQQLINRIRGVLKDGQNLAYFKEALALRGVPVGTVRPPMRTLTADERRNLEQQLHSLSLL